MEARDPFKNVLGKEDEKDICPLIEKDSVEEDSDA